MNVKQTAIKWRVSESSVRKYCKLGIVAACEKINDEWVIGDDSLCPYIFKENIEKNRCLIPSVILKALNRNNTISRNRLNLSENELMDYFKMLVQVGLIYRKRNSKGKDIFKNYILTPKSIELIQKKNFNAHILRYFELTFGAGISIGLKLLAIKLGFVV